MTKPNINWLQTLRHLRLATDVEGVVLLQELYATAYEDGDKTGWKAAREKDYEQPDLNLPE